MDSISARRPVERDLSTTHMLTDSCVTPVVKFVAYVIGNGTPLIITLLSLSLDISALEKLMASTFSDLRLLSSSHTSLPLAYRRRVIADSE
jgi:hypothetical protein